MVLRRVLPGRPSRTAWSACAPLIEKIIERIPMKGLKDWFRDVDMEYSVGSGDQAELRGRVRERKRK